MHKILKLVAICLMVIATNAFAIDEVSTPDRLNDIEITEKIFSKFFKNIHYRVKGVCGWWSFLGGLDVTLEVEHMMPDLVVAVYNRPRSNPWKEVQVIVENKLFIKGAEKAFQIATGAPISYGASDSNATGSSHFRRYLVDVIGSPNILLNPPVPIPYVLHNSNTFPHVPYYLAMTDLISSRLLIPELAYTALHISDGGITGSVIGQSGNVWGYEMPRHMAVFNSNPFRAAVVSAMHGADMVTNGHSGHVLWNSTSNSCGQNCVVSNVTYDEFKKGNIIWQEIFPNNRNIKPGSSDDGYEDNIKGNGNYLFVIWRKYRGCIQGYGRLFFKTDDVGSPVKR